MSDKEEYQFTSPKTWPQAFVRVFIIIGIILVLAGPQLINAIKGCSQ